MATASPNVARVAGLRRRGRFRPGDAALHGVTLAAAASAVALLFLIAWKVLDQARPALHRFGFHFLTTKTWDPGARQVFGAAAFLFGTAVTSLGALLVAGPLSIAIALFLTELAPRWLRGPIGTLVEMLAAVPSVVVGLWGILVMGPFVTNVWPSFTAAYQASGENERPVCANVTDSPSVSPPVTSEAASAVRRTPIFRKS